MRSINKLFIRSHGATLLGALGVFVLVASMGEMFLHNLADNAEKEHFSDSLTFVGTVRAKVESRK